MSSKYKEFVLGQIATELNLLFVFSDSYQSNKDQESVDAICECIEKLKEYEEFWKPYY